MPVSEVENIDCMIRLRETPDKFYDLCIVDPPYGIGASNVKRGGLQHGNSLAPSKEYVKKDWDKESPSDAYFKELFRISKNQIIWGANHFISRVPFDSSCWIVWDKENGDNNYADCELAWTSFSTAVRKVKIRWHGMFQHDMKNKETRIHPTQKPVKLYKWLLKNYAQEGYKILDTHMGSQSSRIAAYDMGFDFWGYELDLSYFESGCNRFKQHISQQVINF